MNLETELTNSKSNTQLKGVAASAGVAIGKVYLLKDDELGIVKRKIPPAQVEREIKRFEDALLKTGAELEAMHAKMTSVLGKNYAKIADAHILILKDSSLKNNVVKKVKDGSNAEYALHEVLGELTAAFDAMDDEYFRERKHDIEDVVKKILLNLLGKRNRQIPDFKEDVVVVAHNLTPADTIAMRESTVKAFATNIGGKTSHTAIVAQTLEIPAVVGLRNITSNVKTGQNIIVDGNKGIVILNPDAATLANYGKQQKEYLSFSKELDKLKDLPATTLDGHSVNIGANIDSPEDINSVLKHGASSVGLYRSEFLYFNRENLPSEQEHYENYSKVVKAMSRGDVVIRTMDLGGDKIAKLGFVDLERERNPFMGLRAIRLSLKYPEVFISQLKGILRASVYGNVKIMYPMISGLGEFREANIILEKAKQELRRDGVPFNENIPVGAMIELPSAAIVADAIAREADFLSIGTNDLIQYTLAVDRVNEHVADLYNPAHPSILKLIKLTIDAGLKFNKPVSMCGEMAGDINYTLFLLGMGLREFSVSAGQILKVKQVVRGINYKTAKQAADELLSSYSKEQTENILNKYKING
jgi:phosphotransferase system enzyme I (PtsI)